MAYLLGYLFLLMAVFLDALNLQLYFSNRTKREDKQKPSSIFGAQVALIVMAALVLGLGKVFGPLALFCTAAAVIFHGINLVLALRK